MKIVLASKSVWGEGEVSVHMMNIYKINMYFFMQDFKGVGFGHCLLRYSYLKVCGCYGVAFLNQTPKFDWYVVPRGSHSKHHKDTCLKEIGPCLQILIITLHSLMNTIWKTYVSSVKNPTNMHY